jgi:histone acetyltransferase (RNA polymerase elongator complex component)
MSKRKELIIPVFLSYLGCKNRCIFCSQNGITENDLTKDFCELDDKVRRFLLMKQSDVPVHIAFYGGTFTSIPIEIQEKYLFWANTWIEKGLVASLRLSTRPDEIREENVKLLKKNHVSTIEIGVQSFDETVLALNRRAYTRKTIEQSIHLLKEYGMTIGIHLMTGLLGSSYERDMYSLRKAIEEDPDFLRIHPTLVLLKTRLHSDFLAGTYTPPNLVETLELCSDMLLICENARIPVIRFGLFVPQENRDQIVAGPFHPAFGDLVKKMAFLKKNLSVVKNDPTEDTVLREEVMRAASSHHGYLKNWLREHADVVI